MYSNTVEDLIQLLETKDPAEILALMDLSDGHLLLNSQQLLEFHTVSFENAVSAIMDSEYESFADMWQEYYCREYERHLRTVFQLLLANDQFKPLIESLRTLQIRSGGEPAALKYLPPELSQCPNLSILHLEGKNFQNIETIFLSKSYLLPGRHNPTWGHGGVYWHPLHDLRIQSHYKINYQRLSPIRAMTKHFNQDYRCLENALACYKQYFAMHEVLYIEKKHWFLIEYFKSFFQPMPIVLTDSMHELLTALDQQYSDLFEIILGYCAWDTPFKPGIVRRLKHYFLTVNPPDQVSVEKMVTDTTTLFFPLKKEQRVLTDLSLDEMSTLSRLFF